MGDTMKKLSVQMAVILAALAMLGSACGDDGGESSGPSTDISATATDFQYDPDGWSIPVGEEFSIEFTNDGNVEHEWAVLTEEISSEDEFNEEIVLFEVEATPAGETATEKFTVDDAGTYQVICALEGHFDAGMEGTLTVE
jgi:plastocyanin